MEYKIGQISEIGGIWCQFVHDNGNGCKSCVFGRSAIKCANPEENLKCAKWIRKDSKSGHFVRLLPLGDVYEQGGDKWQQYKCIEKPNTEDERVYIADTDSDVGLIVSIRLTSSNDMKSEMAEIKNEKSSNTEKIGKNLKSFDLQAAKSGKPVCTRDGRKARIICFDAKCTLPIIALVTNTGGNESLIRYYSNGSFTNLNEAGCDLMMLPEKKEGWINIYNADTTFYYVDGRVFETKDEAVKEAKKEVEQEQREKNEYIGTIRVEWEE